MRDIPPAGFSLSRRPWVHRRCRDNGSRTLDSRFVPPVSNEPSHSSEANTPVFEGGWVGKSTALAYPPIFYPMYGTRDRILPITPKIARPRDWVRLLLPLSQGFPVFQEGRPVATKAYVLAAPSAGHSHAPYAVSSGSRYIDVSLSVRKQEKNRTVLYCLAHRMYNCRRAHPQCNGHRRAVT